MTDRGGDERYARREAESFLELADVAAEVVTHPINARRYLRQAEHAIRALPAGQYRENLLLELGQKRARVEEVFGGK